MRLRHWAFRRVVLLPATTAAILAVSAAALSLYPLARAQSASAQTKQDAQAALVGARREAARAGERAARLDRQAQSSSRAGEGALIEAAALAARVQQAEAALQAAEAVLAAVHQQRRRLDRRLAEQRAPFAQLVAGLQTLLRRPALLTLVQPGSIEDAVHLRAVVAAMEPQIARRTQNARIALGRARKLERDMQAIAQTRQGRQRSLAEQRNRLAAFSAAEMLKSRRAAGAADREAERAFALGEVAQDLAGLVRRLGSDDRSRRAVARASPSGRLTDGAEMASYQLPINGAQAISEDGGVIFLPQPRALAVAPASGRIAFSGPYRGYGTIVIIEHGGGWTSIVTGLASARVGVGQTVIGGFPLGEAALRNPRVRLELRRNGQRVDPLVQSRLRG